MDDESGVARPALEPRVEHFLDAICLRARRKQSGCPGFGIGTGERLERRQCGTRFGEPEAGLLRAPASVPDDGRLLEALRVCSEKTQANEQAVAERPADDGAWEGAKGWCSGVRRHGLIVAVARAAGHGYGRPFTR
jgi:hypothetical protein